eukprot:TRINITY_DN126294_c0_g1_i1.p2 TRINITY_DN126294_c0_g1~~TRINITY_DN126294_c0_g1_i1.p2  ORF type:complete len:123 (-),score=28.06 TRINITY_DN126294_c0_g1_i1:27-395(-)
MKEAKKEETVYKFLNEYDMEKQRQKEGYEKFEESIFKQNWSSDQAELIALLAEEVQKQNEPFWVDVGNIQDIENPTNENVEESILDLKNKLDFLEDIKIEKGEMKILIRPSELELISKIFNA